MVRSTNRHFKTATYSSLTLLSITVASFASGSPSLTNSYFGRKADFGRSPVIVVEGNGFGAKKQAAPVLLDRVDQVYENGVENTAYITKTTGDLVLRPDQDPSAIYGKSSAEIWHATYLKFDASEKQRNHDSLKQYYFKGAAGYAGWPTAYGDSDGSQTPTDNRKLYVAWWYKPLYTPRNFWLLPNEGVSGKFQNGETVTVGSYSATYIGVDADNNINLVFHGASPNGSVLKGLPIRGSQSGATLTFPEIGAQSPGSQKYIRIWEDPQGREGVRFSWTQMHQTIDGVVNWVAAPVDGGEWHLMEVEMDTEIGQITLRTDGKIVTRFNFSPDADAKNKWSPTVAMIGLDGKSGKLQESWLDDIYIDSTFQRVVLGNAANFDEVTHYEIQRPTSWSNDKIEFAGYQGGLPSLENAYIYVFDENGNVNQEGIPVCSDCKAPPSPVTLTIK